VRLTLAVERARPGQGRLVARWIARSLDPSLLPLTIWRSPRAGRYVDSLLEEAPGYYLWRRGGVVAGVAAFRHLDGAAFLNHISIGRRWRGRGWGRRLLAAAAARYLDERPARRIVLDAFAGQFPQAWYRRLGFVRQERQGWYIRSCPAPGNRPLAVPGLAAANRRHRAWGFSTIRVGPYTVGRLWAPYFRLTDPAAARDRDLTGRLAALDPARRLLLVAPTAPRGWTRVARSERLVCSADLLLERLHV
jgi:ribosomal protein S18 acetylase RimI-like enzyme